VETEDTFGIEELAHAGGVSRRTVRYYIQEGLLPAPHGLGRGSHYGPEHVTRLREVRRLQERGLSLGEVRRVVLGEGPVPGPAPSERTVVCSAWNRIELLPGVELHLFTDRRLPSGSALEELSDWCRRHCGRQEGNDA
jgi:DNA-binding transcriptional MerR regulator